MAIQNNTLNTPLATVKPEAKLSTPIKDSLIEERIEPSNFLPTELAKKEIKEFTAKEFISKPLVTFTTSISAGLNMLSAPIRLFKDTNPIKSIVNKSSMFSTKVHLLAYSAAGLIAAHDQKNPLYVFSNLIEATAAVLGLRNIYLFRGIGTGVDGMVGGIKDKHKKAHYSSYQEGWSHSVSVIKDVFKNFFNKLTTDPLSLRKIAGNDLAIVSSAFAALGGIFGMTVHEKSGAVVRDLAGAGGDYGIFRMDSPDAKKAGFFYLAGSVLDFSARIFNKGVANLLGITHIDAFEKLRDAFFEAAIGFDKIGQMFFLRFNQEEEEDLISAAKEPVKTSRKALHQYQSII